VANYKPVQGLSGARVVISVGSDSLRRSFLRRKSAAAVSAEFAYLPALKLEIPGSEQGSAELISSLSYGQM